MKTGRYFLNTPIGPLQERIQAFALFSGTNEHCARPFVMAPTRQMRVAYDASCRRMARDWIEELRDELGIPETPESWRLAT